MYLTFKVSLLQTEHTHSYTAINPWSLFTEAWDTELKKVSQHHIFLFFCFYFLFFFGYTVTKFCLQQAQKRRRDLQTPVMSAHPRILAALPCQLLSQPFFFLWDLFDKSLYAYCDGGAGVKIQGSPDWTGSFLLRPPFWSPGKGLIF